MSNEQKRSERPRLGKLSPKYRFILNPYTDARFTRCPSCEQPTKIRKLPFFIHVDPMVPVILNKTHRYCPDCDLIILHRDELEEILVQMFPDRDPEELRDEYLVIGTVERKAYRAGQQGQVTIEDLSEYLHDFIEVLTIEYRPAGWYPAEEADDVDESSRS
jgi:hypothetical protein